MKALGTIMALLFVFSAVVAWRLSATMNTKTSLQRSAVGTELFNLQSRLNNANQTAMTEQQSIHWLLAQVPRYQESQDAKAGLPGKFIIDPSPQQVNTQRVVATLTNAQVQPVFSQQSDNNTANAQPQGAFSQPQNIKIKADTWPDFELQRCDSLPKDSAGQSIVAECNNVPPPEVVQVPKPRPKKSRVKVDPNWWQDYVLTMVFHGPGAKRAVINGAFVVEGYGLGDGISVYRISESSVFLRKAKSLHQLTLNKYGKDGALTPVVNH